MLIYVVRHGESENNLRKRWTGWSDVHLTDKGKEDAEKAGEYLKSISFDKVFASDLIRAVETVGIALPGHSYETSTDLREINAGTLTDKPLSIVPYEEKENIQKYGYVDHDGESKEQLQSRIRRVMNELETLNCERVALFTHAGWMMGMLDEVLGTFLLRKHVRCNNCAIGIFEFTNGIWKLHSWINLT